MRPGPRDLPLSLSTSIFVFIIHFLASKNCVPIVCTACFCAPTFANPTLYRASRSWEVAVVRNTKPSRSGQRASMAVHTSASNSHPYVGCMRLSSLWPGPLLVFLWYALARTKPEHQRSPIKFSRSPTFGPGDKQSLSTYNFFSERHQRCAPVPPRPPGFPDTLACPSPSSGGPVVFFVTSSLYRL